MKSPESELAGSLKLNLLLLGFVLVVLLFLSECVANIFFPLQLKPTRPSGWAIIPESSWIEYHPVFGWYHQKNKAGFLQKNKIQIPLTTNSHGFRGTREYQNPKPKGVFRILAAGDSFTFGFGVKDAESFPAVMEAKMNSLEVVNLGVAGYGVDQIYLLAREISKELKPDLVVIGLYPEDFWRATRAFNDAGYGKPFFVLEGQTPRLMNVPVPKEKSALEAQFPQTFKPAFPENVLLKSGLFRLLKKSFTILKKQTGLEDPDSSEEWILGRAILTEMIREFRSQGINSVLVLMPPMRWITGTSEPLQDSLRRFSEREDVPFVDLTPVFRNALKESSIEEWYIPDDHHWTAKGNALVADTLLQFIQEIRGKGR